MFVLQITPQIHFESKYHILISMFKLVIRDLESIYHSDIQSQIFDVIQSDVALQNQVH